MFVHSLRRLLQVPISSCNTAFEEIVKTKKRVIVLNKVLLRLRRSTCSRSKPDRTPTYQAELASANQLRMARKTLFVDNEVVIETSVMQQRSAPHNMTGIVVLSTAQHCCRC